MMRKRLSKLRVAAIAPAYGEVMGLRITLRVPVRVAEVEIKPCSTPVMQPSAGGVCLWSKAKHILFGKGKCQLFVKLT